MNPKPELKDIGAWVFLDWRRAGANHKREYPSHALVLRTNGDCKAILSCTTCLWGYTSNPLNDDICGDIKQKWSNLVEDPKWFERVED